MSGYLETSTRYMVSSDQGGGVMSAGGGLCWFRTNRDGWRWMIDVTIGNALWQTVPAVVDDFGTLVPVGRFQ